MYTWDGKGNKNYAMRLSPIFPSSALWINSWYFILQNTGDVALLKLINDFCTLKLP